MNRRFWYKVLITLAVLYFSIALYGKLTAPHVSVVCDGKFVPRGNNVYECVPR